MNEKHEVTYFREDSCDIIFWLKDKKTKAYIDLTGYVFTMALSSVEDPEDPDVAPIKFEVAGVVDLDQTAEGNRGKLAFAPSSSDTDIPEAEYYYDVSYIVGGQKKTVVKNKVWIETNINKTSTP